MIRILKKAAKKKFYLEEKVKKIWRQPEKTTDKICANFEKKKNWKKCENCDSHKCCHTFPTLGWNGSAEALQKIKK